MPRKTPWPPPVIIRDGHDYIRIHLGAGQRREMCLGLAGSEQSKREYARIIAELEVGARRQASPSITVAEIAAEFLTAHQGEDHRTLNHLRVALTPAIRLYGHCRACEFGPVALRTVREEWVKGGYCRFSCNRFAKIVRRWFRWCAGREIVWILLLHSSRTDDTTSTDTSDMSDMSDRSDGSDMGGEAA